MRELISRLTESNVEAIDAYEPRTLAGLSLDTGIPVERLQRKLDEIRGVRSFQFPKFALIAAGVFVALAVGAFALREDALRGAPSKAPLAVAPPETPAYTPTVPSLAGLIALDQVTYGPDTGPYMVEPDFHSSVDLPQGISASAVVSNVLWGAGDAHAAARVKILDSAEREQLTTSVEELLEHVRQRAAKRDLALSPRGSSLEYADGPAYRTTIILQYFQGISSQMVDLPPPGEKLDKVAKQLEKSAAEKAVGLLQDQLKFMADARRAQGP